MAVHRTDGLLGNKPTASVDLVTGARECGHPRGMVPSRMALEPANGPQQPKPTWPADESAEQTNLAAIYTAHFNFVWRCARRLGVTEATLDDVVQEVFLVVQRKLTHFEARSSVRTWLFGITRRVARDQRRSRQRQATDPLETDPRDGAALPADELTALHQQARLLHTLLDMLDDDKRAAFILAELEQMSGPEVAEALQLNLNTAYARIRAAREAFETALHRYEARKLRGAP